MTLDVGRPWSPPTGLEKVGRVSWILLAAVCVVACVGFALLYSAAGGAMDPWAGKQMARFGFGLALMACVAFIPVWFWRGLSIPIYASGLVLLVLVESIGETGMGAQRWIDLGFIRLQPSELVKVALVLLLADLYGRADAASMSWPMRIAVPAALIAIPAALVMRQPDLGTAVLILLGGGAMMFLSGIRLYNFVAVAALSAAALLTVFESKGKEWQLLSDYQFQRIEIFINPEKDPLGAGYHITQSKIALGSGGLHGRGFLKGTQNQLQFLPERHTDFVFTLLAEEFGLIWGLILLSVYGVIVATCVFESLRFKDRFCALLVLGLAATFFLHFSVNLAMVMGLVPVVGLPLPLVSYGGSAMLTLMFSFGLVQSAIIHARR